MKKIAFLFLNFIIISFFTYAQTLEDSLLIYYNWDSTFADQSKNRFDPVFVNATFVSDKYGNLSSAIYFDGIDDYIELPDNIDLKPYFPLSFSLWVKLDELNPQNNIIFHNNFNEYTASGVWMNVGSNSRLAINFGNGNGFYPSARKTFYTDIHIEAEKWYYVTAVYNNRFDTRVFINGEEQYGYLDGAAEDMVYVDGSGNIGRIDANYQLDPYYYKGYMDEFRYWNRGLTNDEVKELYESETLSVEEFGYEVIVSIYPNPTRDYINIIPAFIGEYTACLIDQFGRVCCSKANMEKLDMTSWPNGLYLLQVQTSGGIQFFEKIIKQ